MNTLVVRNVTQKALFEDEIKTQLRDGYWKNTRPLGHWRPWCDVAVVVARDDQPVGRNFGCARDQYNLTAKKFFARNARRMIVRAKVARTVGVSAYRFLIQMYDVDGSWQGPPTGMSENENEVREWIVARGLEKEDLDQVRQVIASLDYAEDRLKVDLKELQAAMRTEVPKIQS